MSGKMINCQSCDAEIAKTAKTCPHCGAKNKKPIFKRWWFWVAVVVILIALFSGGEDAEAPVAENVEVSGSVEHHAADTTAVAEEEISAPEPTVYRVGDVLEDGDMRIVYVSSGEYVEENEFLQPDDGYEYIYLKFYFENASQSQDHSLSMYDFTCYADGYAADMYYAGEEELSATLSAGRFTVGSVYFMVPKDAAAIEVEYETNFFTEDKITFVYEGELDSGYVPEGKAVPTEGAYAIGDVAESSRLKITYLSCEETESDNMFVQPREGYCFMTCEFEFENVGSSDEYVSSFDFDCYADGFSCVQSYLLENDLGAELSAGRKVNGTVTFEVPENAEVVEVEYLSNYWTSNRVVFTVW